MNARKAKAKAKGCHETCEWVVTVVNELACGGRRAAVSITGLGSFLMFSDSLTANELHVYTDMLYWTFTMPVALLPSFLYKLYCFLVNFDF